MNLRTTSVRRQWQVWTCLMLLGIVVYFVLVHALGLGNPLCFCGPHQMRILLPLVVLLRILAREFRWDGVVREEKAEKVKVEGQAGEESESKSKVEVEERNLTSGARSAFTSDEVVASSKVPPVLSTPTPTPTLTPTTYTSPVVPAAGAAELWSQAQAMLPALDPELPIEECVSYMTLVHGAAEGGCIAALARLGELAFNRGALVEAYFWTKMARRRLELEDPTFEQGLTEIGGMLQNIRREWTAAGQPPEFENVYDSFPEERGELGRAFLRLDSGIEVWQTREYLQLLIANGNPDAALFA